MQNLSFIVMIDKNYLEIQKEAWKISLLLPSTLFVLLMSYIVVLSVSRQWKVGSGNQEVSS